MHIIPAVKRLLSLTQCDSKFPPYQGRHELWNHPELQLAAHLAIVLKLLHPFDSVERVVRDYNEPATLRIDWVTWNTSFEDEAISPHSEIKSDTDTFRTTGADVMTMSKRYLDQYLDWYQDTWLEEDAQDRGPANDFSNALKKIFPLEYKQCSAPKKSRTSYESDPGLDKLKRLQSALKVQLLLQNNTFHGKDEALRPGSQYRQFRNGQELPELARPFFKKLASTFGVTTTQLVSVTFHWESRVREWVKTETIRRHT